MKAKSRRHAVAIGGGTGLPRVLSALLRMDHDVTAVVTMADDGGSSGALRREIGMPPPGDVRNCLVALADPDALRSRLFQYRFSQGEGLEGHALGNLIVAALTDLTGDFVEAIRVCEEFLGSKGHVLPSTLTDVLLSAEDRDGNTVTGQAVIARSAVPIEWVRLDPPDAPAYPPVLDAILEADLVVVGPGSLYTSLIPNFLVAGVADALRSSGATRVYLCNVANQRGETGGLDAADHVAALMAHGLQGALDHVVVHDRGAGPPGPEGHFGVDAGPEVRARIAALGPEVTAADVADGVSPTHHRVDGIVAALEEVTGCPSRRR